MKHGTELFKMKDELEKKVPLLVIAVTNGKERLVIDRNDVRWRNEVTNGRWQSVRNRNGTGPDLEVEHILELRRQLQAGIAKMDEFYQTLYAEYQQYFVLRTLDDKERTKVLDGSLADRIYDVLYTYITQKLQNGIEPVSTDLDMSWTVEKASPIERTGSLTLVIKARWVPMSKSMTSIVSYNQMLFCLLFKEVNDDVARFIDAYNAAARNLAPNV